MKITGLNTKSNCYILRRFDGVMLINPSINFAEIKSKIKGMKVWAILLTDAYSGDLGLISRFDCPVYLHKADYFLFADKHTNDSKDEKKSNYNLNNFDLRLVSDETKLKFVDLFVEVIHTPGYTKGSVCYYFDEKLYTGRLFKNDDNSILKSKGYSDYRLKKSIKKIYETFKINTTIYPAYGEEATLLEIRQINSKVRTILKAK